MQKCKKKQKQAKRPAQHHSPAKLLEDKKPDTESTKHRLLDLNFDLNEIITS